MADTTTHSDQQPHPTSQTYLRIAVILTVITAIEVANAATVKPKQTPPTPRAMRSLLRCQFIVPRVPWPEGAIKK